MQVRGCFSSRARPSIPLPRLPGRAIKCDRAVMAVNEAKPRGCVASLAMSTFQKRRRKEVAQLSKQAACRCIAIVDVASEFGRQSAPPGEAVPADPASIIDYMGIGPALNTSTDKEKPRRSGVFACTADSAD